MIRNVLFDIGGVLVDYDWMKYLRDRFKDEKDVQVIADALFKHGVWDEMDRGVWTEEELIEGFVAPAPAYREKILDAWNNCYGSMRTQPYAHEWLSGLKENGVKIYYLSNWSQHLYKNEPGVLSFLPLFDGGVFSFREKLIKPDRAIYERICNLYQLKPEECVFIDDKKENVDAAVRVGIHGIWFQSYEQAKTELKNLLDLK